MHHACDIEQKISNSEADVLNGFSLNESRRAVDVIDDSVHHASLNFNGTFEKIFPR